MPPVGNRQARMFPTGYAADGASTEESAPAPRSPLRKSSARPGWSFLAKNAESAPVYGSSKKLDGLGSGVFCCMRITSLDWPTNGILPVSSSKNTMPIA